MAERKARRAGAARGKKPRADVIDVKGEESDEKSDEKDAEAGDGGDDGDEKDTEGGEGDGDGEDKDASDDDFLADAAQVIDVSEDGVATPSGEWPIPEEPSEAKQKRERGGSLVKRDPLQAYMQEARRYP